MNVPENLFYTKEHEWVRFEGNKAVTGISDHAQHALGDITYAECAKLGKDVKQSEQLATVESVKAASDVYAAVSGKVVKVNAELSRSPDIINSSPYEKGWFAEIEFTDAGEKANLMTATQYKEYLKEIE